MPDGRMESFVVFQLAGTAYGIASRLVKQIDMVEEVTPVPNAPAFVEGIVFLRGKVVPAIDLRTRLGFPTVPRDVRTRLVILEDEERTVGLIVDTAREFLRIPDSALQPPPDALAGFSGQYLAATASVNDRLILILDAHAILQLPEAAPISVKEGEQHGQAQAAA